jgi:hypothetical protein
MYALVNRRAVEVKSSGDVIELESRTTKILGDGLGSRACAVYDGLTVGLTYFAYASLGTCADLGDNF